MNNNLMKEEEECIEVAEVEEEVVEDSEEAEVAIEVTTEWFIDQKLKEMSKLRNQ